MADKAVRPRLTQKTWVFAVNKPKGYVCSSAPSAGGGSALGKLRAHHCLPWLGMAYLTKHHRLPLLGMAYLTKHHRLPLLGMAPLRSGGMAAQHALLPWVLIACPA